jgi:hypothetical protein
MRVTIMPEPTIRIDSTDSSSGLRLSLAAGVKEIDELLAKKQARLDGLPPDPKTST